MERIDPGRLDSAIEQQVSYLKKSIPSASPNISAGAASWIRRPSGNAS
jgi:hypothetical protein